jgi:DNA-binding transcriptional LysR family regulator
MLNASQPGLSRMMKHLEGRLGFLLFDRVGGRLLPTAEADALFLEIEHIHYSIENLDHIVARLGAGENLIFRLGASPSLGRGFAPELLRGLQDAHPRLVIQFDVLSVEQVSDHLIAGRCEYALTVYPIDHPNLLSRQIGATPLVAVLPACHPLLVRTPLSIGDLEGQRLISFPPNSPHGRAIAEMSERTRPCPYPPKYVSPRPRVRSSRAVSASPSSMNKQPESRSFRGSCGYLCATRPRYQSFCTAAELRRDRKSAQRSKNYAANWERRDRTSRA